MKMNRADDLGISNELLADYIYLMLKKQLGGK